MTNRCRAVAVVLSAALSWVLAGAPAWGQGYICAEGGGAFGRGAWSEPIVAWMVEKGQKGRVVILGAARDAGQDEPEPAARGGEDEPKADPLVERFRAAGAAGVTDLRLDAASARGPAAAKAIDEATIVFIRGGSQTRYVNDWRGTPVEASLRALFKRGGVIGGTSAGCAVLGEVIYDAQKGSLASADILRDGRHERLTLATGFLELTPGVLFDTHFTERGRLPRLAVMLAAARADLKREVLGVGIDTRTALCISPDGTAEVMGDGSVTLLQLPAADAQGAALAPVLRAGSPPAVTGLTGSSLVAGYRVDLRARRVIGRPAHASVFVGEHPLPRTAPHLKTGRARGGAIEDADAGEQVLEDGDEPRALRLGALREVRGQARWRCAVVQPRTLDDRDRVENRVGGLMWLLARHPGWIGVMLSSGIDAEADARGLLRARLPARDADEGDGVAGAKPSALIVIDTHAITSVAESLALDGPESEGPRQSVALEGFRLHILPPAWGFRPLPPSEAATANQAGPMHPAEFEGR